MSIRRVLAYAAVLAGLAGGLSVGMARAQEVAPNDLLLASLWTQRSVEDPRLLDELARRGIVLEVCPGSNVALGIYPDRAAHPLHRLIAAGVRVTLNSDDPPFFNTTLGAEYDAAGLDAAALRGITRTALEASFADAATRQRLLRGIEP